MAYRALLLAGLPVLLAGAEVAEDPYAERFHAFTPEVPNNVVNTMLEIHRRLPKPMRLGGIVNLTGVSRLDAADFVKRKASWVYGERQGIQEQHLKRYPMLQEVAKRIAEYAKIPFHVFKLGLEMELLHYHSAHVGIIWHHDRGLGGHRLLSGLLYLNDMEPTDGGSTAFPKMALSGEIEGAVAAPSIARVGAEMDAPDQFKFVPRAGQVALWSNHYCSGSKCTPDNYKMHYSTPMVEGSPRKYAVNIWFSCDTPDVAKQYQKWLQELKGSSVEDAHTDTL